MVHLLITIPIHFQFEPLRLSGASMLQAAQVRKDCYVPENGVAYDPDACQTCTIACGTLVQQVCNAVVEKKPYVHQVVSLLFSIFKVQCCCCRRRLHP